MTVAVKMLKGTCPGSTHMWLCHAHLREPQGIDGSHPKGRWWLSLHLLKSFPWLFLSVCNLGTPIVDNLGQGGP